MYKDRVVKSAAEAPNDRLVKVIRHQVHRFQTFCSNYWLVDCSGMSLERYMLSTCGTLWR